MTDREPTHPWELFEKECLTSITEWAEKLDCWDPIHLARAIKHKDRIHPITAADLERFTGKSAKMWLELQYKHDLWKAKQYLKELEGE